MIREAQWPLELVFKYQPAAEMTAGAKPKDAQPRTAAVAAAMVAGPAVGSCSVA